MLEKIELRGDRKADLLGNCLHEWIGGTMEVEACKRMRKDVYVLAIDHPDPFVHRVPEEVLEGNVRGTEETSLGFEGNADLRPSGPTFQGLSRDQYEAGTINLAMHFVYIAFQCGGVDERDRGLLHVEEDMLDASAAYRADPISLRKRAPEQHLDGIGDCVDSDISTASLLLGG